MAINTYLFFEGRTEEALEFYRKALGAEVQMVMRYKDSPQGPKGPDGRAMPPEKVMHASALIGGSVVMASDGFCSGKPSFGGFSLSFEAKDEADAKKRFDALSADGRSPSP